MVAADSFIPLQRYDLLGIRSPQFRGQSPTVDNAEKPRDNVPNLSTQDAQVLANLLDDVRV